MRKEVVVYCGISFTRYPDSPHRHRRVYFWADKGTRQRTGVTSLHRAVYTATYGPIPPGKLIHHRDLNPLNNAPENLEALTVAEHSDRHADEYIGHWRMHAAAIRPLAAAWHGSEEGLAWHSEHGKRTWETREPARRTCVQCGKPYGSLARRADDRFCSRQCISRWHEANRTYHEDRACIACGAVFNVKKSKQQQTCSRVCGWKIRRQGANVAP